MANLAGSTAEPQPHYLQMMVYQVPGYVFKMDMYFKKDLYFKKNVNVEKDIKDIHQV